MLYFLFWIGVLGGVAIAAGLGVAKILRASRFSPTLAGITAAAVWTVLWAMLIIPNLDDARTELNTLGNILLFALVYMAIPSAVTYRTADRLSRARAN